MHGVVGGPQFMLYPAVHTLNLHMHVTPQEKIVAIHSKSLEPYSYMELA